jgi:hypothetical protein
MDLNSPRIYRFALDAGNMISYEVRTGGSMKMDEPFNSMPNRKDGSCSFNSQQKIDIFSTITTYPESKFIMRVIPRATAPRFSHNCVFERN